MYQRAAIAREEHVPVMIHVKELTQPQGHSTSGSHERYKDTERLAWEKEYDCNAKMREWILNFELEDVDGQMLKFVENEAELIALEKEAKTEVRNAKTKAWNEYLKPMLQERKELLNLLEKAARKSENEIFIEKLKRELESIDEPIQKKYPDCWKKEPYLS